MEYLYNINLRVFKFKQLSTAFHHSVEFLNRYLLITNTYLRDVSCIVMSQFDIEKYFFVVNAPEIGRNGGEGGGGEIRIVGTVT